jgi:hypothetical protein
VGLHLIFVGGSGLIPRSRGDELGGDSGVNVVSPAGHGDVPGQFEIAHDSLHVAGNGTGGIGDGGGSQPGVVKAAMDEAGPQIVVGHQPGSAFGVVHDHDLEPGGVRGFDLVQVTDPGEVIEDSRGDAAADGAGDDRVAERQPEQIARVDSRIDTGDDVDLLVRDERDRRDVPLRVRPGEVRIACRRSELLTGSVFPSPAGSTIAGMAKQR